MANDTKMNKGELITIATGEYSDYTVTGVFRILDDFEPQEVIDEYLREHPDQREPYSADISGFLAWLGRKCLIDPVDSREWHIGSYSTFQSTLL